MGKFINAEKLKAKIPDDMPYKGAIRRLLEQAEEDVVRCKGCAYLWEISKGNFWCDRLGDSYNSFKVSPTDFCSMGKKKEGQEWN